MGFGIRSYWHDHLAIPEVVHQLEARNHKVIRQGHERDHPEIRELLAGNRNNTSLMIRYKPDLLACNLDTGDITQWEVKSDLGGHPNFAIEFDSYISTIEHGNRGDVNYAFVDLQLNESVYTVASSVYCKVTGIRFPKEVHIPMRRDYLETEQYIRDKYPTVNPKLVSYNGNGSGTAYFLISKYLSVYKQWDELLPVPPLETEEYIPEAEQLSFF